MDKVQQIRRTILEKTLLSRIPVNTSYNKKWTDNENGTILSFNDSESSKTFYELEFVYEENSTKMIFRNFNTGRARNWILTTEESFDLNKVIQCLEYISDVFVPRNRR